MLLIKLQGGLGNQMFQYAAARSLVKKERRIFLDYQFFENNTEDSQHFTSREYELNIFKNLKVKRATINQVKFFKDQSIYFKFLRFVSKTETKYVIQENNEYIPLSNLSGYSNLYLDGYFQSEMHFKHIRKQILHDFRFPELDVYNEELRKEIGKNDSVGLHIRRGDYSKSKDILDYHGLLPQTYYHTALDVLESQSSDLQLFIFSDDIKWAKENFIRPGIITHFIDHNPGPESWKDMALMSYCKHHIIANSSFSWWAAWLSERKGKVFAPAQWFNSLKVKFDIRDFIPAHWEIVSYE